MMTAVIKNSLGCSTDEQLMPHIWDRFRMSCTLHRDMRSVWKDLLVITDSLFVRFSHVAELAIRICAERPKHCFENAWNVLDSSVN